MHKRMRELQNECISAGCSGEQGKITPEQHLCDCMEAFCLQNEGMCFSALVYFYALTWDVRVCIRS